MDDSPLLLSVCWWLDFKSGALPRAVVHLRRPTCSVRSWAGPWVTYGRLRYSGSSFWTTIVGENRHVFCKWFHHNYSFKNMSCYANQKNRVRTKLAWHESRLALLFKALLWQSSKLAKRHLSCIDPCNLRQKLHVPPIKGQLRVIVIQYEVKLQNWLSLPVCRSRVIANRTRRQHAAGRPLHRWVSVQEKLLVLFESSKKWPK